ncbi:MAG: LysE family transporter, partial [Gammaproteobacteria bacterium]
FKYLFKGMIINLLNPFLLVFWISLISVVEANYNYDDKGNRYFFLGVLTISLILDISKSLLAQKLKDLIQPKVISSVNKILSIVMLLFSLRIGYALITS